MVTLFELLIIGVGFTVIVIIKTEPSHKSVIEEGVTMYSTVPVAELLELVSI